MQSFRDIYSIAEQKMGGKAVLNAIRPTIVSDNELKSFSSAFYLSCVSKRIFQAGFHHRVVESKWPGVSKLFKEFEPKKVVWMDDEEIGKLMTDQAMIRHWKKIQSVQKNAQAILDIEQECGTVGDYLTQWNGQNIVECWFDIRKRFNRMGGNSAAMFLRMVGKDTFIFTDYVVEGLLRTGLIDQRPNSMRDTRMVQGIFNQWQDETGRDMADLSKILACSVG